MEPTNEAAKQAVILRAFLNPFQPQTFERVVNEPDRVLLTSPTELLSGFFRRRRRRRRRSSTRRSIFTFESSTFKKAKGPQVHCRRKDPKSCTGWAAKNFIFLCRDGLSFRSNLDVRCVGASGGRRREFCESLKTEKLEGEREKRKSVCERGRESESERQRWKEQRTLIVEGRITVQLASSLTRLELTNEENMLLWECSETVESKLVILETSGQSYNHSLNRKLRLQSRNIGNFIVSTTLES